MYPNSYTGRRRNGRHARRGFTLLEILLVVGPLVLLFLVLMLANRRAKRLSERDDSSTSR